jgi:hypothetical protein
VFLPFCFINFLSPALPFPSFCISSVLSITFFLYVVVSTIRITSYSTL